METTILILLAVVAVGMIGGSATALLMSQTPNLPDERQWHFYDWNEDDDVNYPAVGMVWE